MFEKSIQIKGELIDFKTPKIMGILNVTPDSFYDGGRFESKTAALKQTEIMLEEGAHIIDVGAMSSRPGSETLTLEEEKQRLFPILESLLKEFPSRCFSVDTFYSAIAKESIEIGASIINDISAGQADPEMFTILGQTKATYIMMHKQGDPKNMQNKPQYENVVSEILTFFSKQKRLAEKAGINDLIIDPGFGFGKTLTHNYEILNNLNAFQCLNLPVMVGLSRKSMIYKVLSIMPDEALNGTSVLHTKALLEGANLLRVHDVKAAKECVELVALLQ